MPNRDPGPVMTNAAYRHAMAVWMALVKNKYDIRMTPPVQFVPPPAAVTQSMNNKSLDNLHRMAASMRLVPTGNRYAVRNHIKNAATERHRRAFIAVGGAAVSGAVWAAQFAALLEAVVYAMSYELQTPERLRAFAQYKGVSSTVSQEQMLKALSEPVVLEVIRQQASKPLSTLSKAAVALAKKEVAQFTKHERARKNNNNKGVAKKRRLR